MALIDDLKTRHRTYNKENRGREPGIQNRDIPIIKVNSCELKPAERGDKGGKKATVSWALSKEEAVHQEVDQTSFIITHFPINHHYIGFHLH